MLHTLNSVLQVLHHAPSPERRYLKRKSLNASSFKVVWEYLVCLIYMNYNWCRTIAISSISVVQIRMRIEISINALQLLREHRTQTAKQALPRYHVAVLAS